MQRVKSYLR